MSRHGEPGSEVPDLANQLQLDKSRKYCVVLLLSGSGVGGWSRRVTALTAAGPRLLAPANIFYYYEINYRFCLPARGAAKWNDIEVIRRQNTKKSDSV